MSLSLVCASLLLLLLLLTVLLCACVVYGVLDFVRLPYQQYQEDGRLVWGLQQGTSALTSSTGVAVVELTSQLLETIQGLAQMAYDMVSPSERPSQPHPQQPKPYQPLDFREGFSNAYDVVYAVSYNQCRINILRVVKFCALQIV